MLYPPLPCKERRKTMISCKTSVGNRTQQKSPQCKESRYKHRSFRQPVTDREGSFRHSLSRWKENNKMNITKRHMERIWTTRPDLCQSVHSHSVTYAPKRHTVLWRPVLSIRDGLHSRFISVGTLALRSSQTNFRLWLILMIIGLYRILFNFLTASESCL